MSLIKCSTSNFSKPELIATTEKANITLYPGHVPSIHLKGHVLPSLCFYHIDYSPHIIRYTKSHRAAETQDNLTLIMPMSSVQLKFQNAVSVDLLQGDAILIPNDISYTIDAFHSGNAMVIKYSEALITPRIANLGDCLMKKITTTTTSTPEWELLKNYVAVLAKIPDELSSEFTQLASSQIMDLLILLLGAKKEEVEFVKNGGLRSVRMRAIKHDIQRHLTDNTLSINQVAMRQGISPQYIRSLFNTEGLTFSDYVNQVRLEHAYQILNNPLNHQLNILTIAYNLGFNNVSWFNNLFKKRFGMNPSDVRELTKISYNSTVKLS